MPDTQNTWLFLSTFEIPSAQGFIHHSFIKSCRQKRNHNSNSPTTPTHMVALPFTQHSSETTSRILREDNVNIAHKPESSLRAQLSKPSDHLNKFDRTDVIYRFPYEVCEAKYVDQTIKSLFTWLTKHQRAVRLQGKLSLVATQTHTHTHTHTNTCSHGIRQLSLAQGH